VRGTDGSNPSRSGGESRANLTFGPHPIDEPSETSPLSSPSCGDTLKRIRRTIGEYNFADQYQQSPAPLGGGLVKVEWFKRYRENERPERFDRIVQSWDTANKASELSDFSVCTT
jgi:hypothetical protein